MMSTAAVVRLVATLVFTGSLVDSLVGLVTFPRPDTPTDTARTPAFATRAGGRLVPYFPGAP